MTRVQEMQAELRVLEAFNDTTRATILRSMLEYEIAAEEKSHVNGIGGSYRSLLDGLRRWDRTRSHFT